jgi:tRNA-modifying protein YgfZ
MVFVNSATQMTQTPVYPHIRPDRAVISVGGEGALAFLHNLLTVDLLEKKPGETAYGALLSPQGKILHDVFVFVEADRVLMDCAATQAGALLQKLVMYRLRAKLEIKQEPALRVAVGRGAADPRLGVLGLRGVVEADALPNGDEGQYDLLRLLYGLGDSVLDIGSGEMFVHEANLDFFSAVSFTKGCYVGQEVVSRVHHRGTARNRIMPLKVVFGPLPIKGTEISSDGQRLGEMLSGQGARALGLIRLDRLAEATGPLLAGESNIIVDEPVWKKT